MKAPINKTLASVLLIALAIHFSQAQEAGVEEASGMEFTYTCTKADGSVVYETKLLVNEEASLFIDSLPKTVVELYGFRTTVPFQHHRVRTDLSSLEIENQRMLDDGTVLLANWQPGFDWEITDKTKTIMGRTARKAVTASVEIDPNNTYYYGKAIAWFTTDIPLPTGPARYGGLPGLILLLEYEKSDIRYELKDMATNQQAQEIPKLAGGDVVDKLDVIYFFHKNEGLIRDIRKKQKGK